MIWLDSAVWGQVDSIGTAALLFSLSALVRGKTVRGAILAALAAVLKPQFGILIPIVAVLAFVRARSARDPWAFVVSGLAGAATIALARPAVRAHAARRSRQGLQRRLAAIPTYRSTPGTPGHSSKWVGAPSWTQLDGPPTLTRSR